LSDIYQFLNLKSELIIKCWFECIIKTYPNESIDFFKRTDDVFYNPVGSVIYREIRAIYEELLVGRDYKKISFFINKIVRIRAVQDHSPSLAVSFMLELKTIVREVFNKEFTDAIVLSNLWKELVKFELLIDKLALIAFDEYVVCRQKIYELQAQEIKSMYYNILRQTNLIFQQDRYTFK